MALYAYLGPERLRGLASAGIPRCALSSGLSAAALAEVLGPDAAGDTVFTYVVDGDGTLWIADRHSEHVACARGGPVRAAGELVMEIGAGPAVLEATNLSTGFCPPPTCWDALAEALHAACIPGPGGFAHAFEYRRCTACAAISVLKPHIPDCAECGAALPEDDAGVHARTAEVAP